MIFSPFIYLTLLTSTYSVRPYSKHFPSCNWSSFQQFCEVGAIIILILQIRTLSPPGSPPRSWRCWYPSSPAVQLQRLCPFYITLCCLPKILIVHPFLLIWSAIFVYLNMHWFLVFFIVFHGLFCLTVIVVALWYVSLTDSFNFPSSLFSF